MIIGALQDFDMLSVFGVTHWWVEACSMICFRCSQSMDWILMLTGTAATSVARSSKTKPAAATLKTRRVLADVSAPPDIFRLDLQDRTYWSIISKSVLSRSRTGVSGCHSYILFILLVCWGEIRDPHWTIVSLWDLSRSGYFCKYKYDLSPNSFQSLVGFGSVCTHRLQDLLLTPSSFIGSQVVIYRCMHTIVDTKY